MVIDSIIKLKKLRENVGLGMPQLQEIQRRKLNALIRHACENVPYYRNLFREAGIKPDDVQSVEDLARVPITEKKVMRSLDRKEVLAANVDPKRCLAVFTSGSTGMPTHIYLTREDYECIDLVYLRSFLENGLSFLHKRAFILDPHSFDTRRRWYQSLGLARSVNISCFLEPEEQMRMLADARPDFIHGYPSSLGQVARLVAERGPRNGIRPAVVSTAAEVLHAKDRKRIAAAFGVMPFDRYAARECGNIAWECEKHNGYHINVDTLVVEFVKDNRHVMPGQRGDVVITNLHSYAMPFIRYRIGDLGVPSDKTCGCGRALPLMEIIEGRDEDFIVLKGGRRISPMMVTGTLDHIPGIRQFRVIQENADSVVAWISAGKGFKPDTAVRVEEKLKEILGNGIGIVCREVDDIPREPSGKVRAVISRLS
ncbi:MAG: phenylacetate--CoA ligase family protein [Deltaproteobacteria bacterium]|nr:phenylacetate--CoA ligase family protein [Deltaproteobacteria bacterium]